jgi:hypothetical protein
MRKQAGSGIMETEMSNPRFPVTVTRLPLLRCQICQRTIAHRPGQASAVLTEHYRRAHPESLQAAGQRSG